VNAGGTNMGDGLRYGTSGARWVLAAAVLGSGVVFLDSTVVNVALPTIGKDLHAGITALQWTIDAYLVTLSALLLLGGNLGDHYGRRSVFVIGLIGFVGASLVCAAAPNAGVLVAARALQGVGGALLVPGSLAIISTTFHPDDRAQAIGMWSGLAGVVSALGPFLGGWLIDVASWRLIFLINVPVAALAVWIALRRVPDTREHDPVPTDWAGAALVSVGLAALAYALIERHGAGLTTGLVGAGTMVAFVLFERRTTHPMLPLGIFRSAQFTGANVTTFAVYGALGGALFLVVLQLQVSLGYSALSAGASLVPFTVLMLLFSPGAGKLAQRVGPRLPMTAGPLITATGLALFTRIGPGARFASTVLPAVVVFGVGMTLTVAPLTATVIGSVDDDHAGVASGINNAVARLSGLLTVAVLPALAGVSGPSLAGGLRHGFATAMWVSSGVCATGAVASFALIRRAAPVPPRIQANTFFPCTDAPTANPAAGSGLGG
jgi:EmrB/QacA subfamily drug resistance transporter